MVASVLTRSEVSMMQKVMCEWNVFAEYAVFVDFYSYIYTVYSIDFERSTAAYRKNSLYCIDSETF